MNAELIDPLIAKAAEEPDAPFDYYRFVELIAEECAKACEAVDTKRQAESWNAECETAAINQCAEAVRRLFR